MNVVPDMDVGPIDSTSPGDMPDVPCSGHEVGASPEDVVESGEERATGAGESQVVEKPSTNDTPRFIYFLRTPKPDTADVEMRISSLRSEVQSFKEGCDKVLAAAKLALEHKHACRDEYDVALEVFKKSRAQRDAQHLKLQPLRDTQRKLTEMRSTLNDKKRELPAASLDDLDRMIDDLEFRQSHETLTKQEENRIISDINRLKRARPEVARLEGDFAQIDAHREDAATLQATKGELEKQLDIVTEEVSVAKAQMEEKWQTYSTARANQEAASEEFQRLREMKDAKFDELRAVQASLRKLQDGYFSNRRFAQQVRAMLAEGKVEDAKEACSEQVELAVEGLLTDRTAYEDHTTQWELQRKYAVSQASINLEDPSRKSKQKAAAASKVPVAPGQPSDVDSIVEGILAECKGGKGRGGVAAELAPTPTNGASNGAAAAAISGGPEAAPPGEKVREAPLAAAAKPKAAPKKPRAVKGAPHTAAAPIVDTDDTFVPPKMDQIASATLTHAEVKARVREEQAAKAGDAAARKRKAEERKAAKAKRAAEVARQKEETEAARREAEAARVKREADAQRAIAAKRKAAAERKAEQRAQPKPAVKKLGKAPALARGRKNTVMGTVSTFAYNNRAVLALSGLVVLLSTVFAFVLSM